MRAGPRIIGLSGKARSGKDSAFDFIHAALAKVGIEARRVAFADGVREEAKLAGWDGVKDEAGRTMLQNVGMTRRLENPRYWINKAFGRILHEFFRAEEAGQEVIWVITDVRFLNEMAAILKADGRVWRIERRDPETHELHDNGLTPEQKAHASETELDGREFAWVISAETLDELAYMVDRGLAHEGLL
ncbi:MAG: hypothetical protein WA766_21130 [Candidatus Acidiferrales bacterium]